MKVLNNRLLRSHSKESLTGKHQVGFMPQVEGLSAVASLIEIAQRRLHEKKETWVAFLDLRKSFDLVPHNLMLQKLMNKGVGIKFLELIKNIYENSMSEIRIGKASSKSFKVSKGVRQGCPLSPLLFDISIDDIFANIKPISVACIENNKFYGTLFADDTLILSESQEEMIEKLEQVKYWMCDNNMEVNTEKSGIMRIPSTNDLIEIKYDNQKIPVIKKYTYLGIEINDRLNETEMANFRINN
ncbi:hypothetical protein NUSPORA_01416 [Nucleospora cyclopteri]